MQPSSLCDVGPREVRSRPLSDSFISISIVLPAVIVILFTLTFFSLVLICFSSSLFALKPPIRYICFRYQTIASMKVLIIFLFVTRMMALLILTCFFILRSAALVPFSPRGRSKAIWIDAGSSEARCCPSTEVRSCSNL